MSSIDAALSGLPVRTRSSESTVFRRFAENRTAMFGALVLLALIVIAVLADRLVPYNPQTSAGQPLLAPSADHWMGTDNFGRDGFSRFIFGVRTSLIVGFGAATLSSIIGILIGAIAGFVGGWVDSVLMRLADVLLTIPLLVLGLVMAAFLGGSIVNIIIIIGLLTWPRSARLVRSSFLSLREREFVQAAHAVGSSTWWIVFREVLPNALPPAIVNWSLEVGLAIVTEAGLSFLGLGDPEAGSWGTMLQDAQRFLRSAWWMSVFPGFGIALTALSANLVGEGLNDALNPKFEDR